jgi:hypothetical protein
MERVQPRCWNAMRSQSSPQERLREWRARSKGPFDDRRLKEMGAIAGTIVTFTGTGIITRLIHENVIL